MARKTKVTIQDTGPIQGAFLERDNHVISAVAEFQGADSVPHAVFYGPDQRKPALAVSYRPGGGYDVQFSGDDFPRSAKIIPLEKVVQACVDAGLIAAAPKCDCPCHAPAPEGAEGGGPVV
jgi:hypothetical protein